MRLTKPDRTRDVPPYGFAWSFVALEYYALILNRVYLVLVGDRVVAGAYMRGPIAAVPFPETAWQPGYWLSERQLRRYGGVDVSGAEFPGRHWFNFQLRRSEIADVRFNARPKWGMGTVPYSGRLHVTLRSGRQRELILLGGQDGPSIRDRLLPSAARSSVAGDEAVPPLVFDPFRPLFAPGS
jgi:hypothetical protein